MFMKKTIHGKTIRLRQSFYSVLFITALILGSNPEAGAQKESPPAKGGVVDVTKAPLDASKLSETLPKNLFIVQR
jgi:hypothetical protein